MRSRLLAAQHARQAARLFAAQHACLRYKKVALAIGLILSSHEESSCRELKRDAL
jgi:hypothetical protein